MVGYCLQTKCCIATFSIEKKTAIGYSENKHSGKIDDYIKEEVPPKGRWHQPDRNGHVPLRLCQRQNELQLQNFALFQENQHMNTKHIKAISTFLNKDLY